MTILFLSEPIFKLNFFSDPPLDEEDIPAGMWLCHSCKFLNAQVHNITLRESYIISLKSH